MDNNDTEGKDLEGTKKDSETKYRTLFEQAADAIVLIDPENGDLVEFNNKTYEQLGYTQEEFKQLKIPDFEIIESAEEVKEHIENIAREGSDKFETKHRTKAGDIRDIHVSAKTMDIRGKKFIQAIWRDITEQKRAEQKLKESEKKLRILFDKAGDSIGIHDLEGNMLEVNQTLCERLGYTREELLKMSPSEIDTPEYAKLVSARISELVERGFLIFESAHKTKDGKIIPIEVSSGIINYGDKSAVLSIARDITDRKKAEESIQYQAQLVEHLSDAIISTDLDFNINSWNNAAELIYGWKAEEVTGKKIRDVIKVNYPYDDEEAVLKEFLEKGIWKGEVIQKHKDGTSINILASVSLIKDNTGKPVAAVAINRDITVRKTAEQKLKESEERYRNLINNIHETIFELDENGNIEYMSPQVYEISGYRPEEQIGVNLKDLIHPDDLELVLINFKNLIQSGKVQTADFRRKHKDGHYVYVNSSGRRVKIGNKYKIIGVTKDITERKIAEQKLIESEEKYRNIFEKSANALVILDYTGKIIDCNSATETIFGYSRDDLIGQNYLKLPFYDESMTEVLKERFQAITKEVGLKQQELEIKKKNGDTARIKSEISYVTIGGQKFFQAIIQDITEQKNAEDKLKDSEEKYRKISERYEMLLESITDAIFVINRDWVYTLVNKLAEKIVNMPVDKLLGNKITDVFPGIENTSFFKTYETVMNTRKPERVRDTFVLPDGQMGYYEVSVYPISEGILCIGRNVTEEVEAGQKLKESEEKYKNLADELEMILDHIPALVFYKDMENNFIRLNKYHADAHKLRKEDMQGVSCFNIYPKAQAQAYWDDDLEVARTKKPKFNIIEPWDTPEGTRWALTSKIPYFDEQGKITGIIGLASDITERINAEEKLKESEANYRDAYEQAEFYKDLFAHDISNILQNIQSSLGLLSMWQNKPEKMNKISELMTIISDQLIRGSKLVANIRKLSEISEAESHLEPLDGLQILKDAKKFIHKSYPYKDLNIEVESEFEEVNIKANQLLLDVFENILFNSIKYNQNKKIDILTKISKEIKNGIKYVKIEFIDNGIGVPDVMKERIFKGISDRKEKIHGMGLGLLLVKRVLSIYNGDISVEDKVKGDPSQGSNFIILIPEVV